MSRPESTRSARPHPGRFVLLVLLCMIAAGVSMLQWRQVSPPPVPVELERAQLELVAARLCLRGTTNAFSGFLLEHYSDGSRQSRSGVLNGQLHGVSEGWHTNGVLQVRETFAHGVSDGPRTKWYPSGIKMSETPVVAGKVEGVYRRWDAEGRLAEEVEMRQGQPDGRSRAYYPSGCVRFEARMRRGEVTGQTAWKDGEQPAALATAQAN
jgi:hypothetical protein